MKTIHASLVRKYPWYQKWHEYKGHITIHWLVFIIAMIILSSLFLNVQAVPQVNPPTVNITYPVYGSNVMTNAVQLSYTVTGSPTSCYYDMGGEQTYPLPNCQGTTLNLISNDYVINVYASNQAGTDFASTSFTVANTNDTTKPVITNFTIPSTSSSLTVPITTFTATDNVGVVAYMLRQTSNTPSSNNYGWKTNVPTSYIFTTPGTKTLYAWTKDAGGNVSLSSSGQVTIGNDTTPPVINTFTTPLTSTSTTITGITFTATDNTGVTGYKITESNTAPTSGWLSSAPTSYTLTTTGTGEKTLYAWTRDAAGNVSSSKTSVTNYSLHFYYLSPSGNDSNPCTFTSPCFTLNRAWQLVTAGDTVYMRGGTYAFNSQQSLSGKSGNSTNMIRVWNYINEKPIFDYSGLSTTAQVAGVYTQSANYLHIKGIRITNLAQQVNGYAEFGMVISYGGSGSSNIIVENCEFDHIGGVGFKISGYAFNVTIINCDSHHNADPNSPSQYDGGDGFGINNLGTNVGNIKFKGCRSWMNSDDGWDFFGTSGDVTIENSWSFWNGYIEGFIHAGNGDGFKLGPANSTQTNIIRTIKNSLAAENYLIGFDQNIGNSTQVYPSALYNNTSYKNGHNDIHFGGWLFYGFNASNILKNNLDYLNGAPATINAFNPETTQDHNSWNLPVTVNNYDFTSFDSSQLDNPRSTDGSLPITTFLHLAQGSDLINTGINVGLPYNGSAPDLGAFETQ